MSQQIDREHKIRELAYEIWQGDGRPSGRDVQHWLAAERQIEAGDITTRVKTKTKPAKSRGSLSTPISRKVPVVKTMHAAKTPARKTLSPPSGKKMPPAAPNGKSSTPV